MKNTYGKDQLDKDRKPSKTKSSHIVQTKQAESSEMDHTPNKQSKTDPDDSPEGFTNPVAVHMHASQMDDFDPEFEWTNFGNQRTSQVKPQSHCQSYIYNSPKKESVISLSSSFSTDFQLNRTTNSLTSNAHTVTPFGDNFSSYLKPKSMELSVAPAEERHNPSVSCLPSQPDSTLDFGYSSNSGHSSYQGQDNNSSQQDDPTVDQGSQLDLPMSQSVGWSNENCFENCLYGENELEDLLYHFQKYFEGRLETEVKQFQESVHDQLETVTSQFKESVQQMILEQQSHVRQIVHLASSMRSQSSQSVADEQEKNLPDSSQPQSDVVSRLLDGSLYIPDEDLDNLRSSLTRQIQPSRYEKRTKLLELLADSCSLSSLFTKSEYR